MKIGKLGSLVCLGLLYGASTSRAEEGSAAPQPLSLVWAAASQGRFSNCVVSDLQGNALEAGYDLEALEGGRSQGTAFVAKFSSGGKPLWRSESRHVDGASVFYAAVVDGSGNAYAGGLLSGRDADFGNKVRLDDPRPRGREASMRRMLLVKYDASGRAQWAQTGPVREQTELGSLAVDRSGNVFTVGYAWEDAEETNDPIGFRDAAPGFKVMPNPAALEGSVLAKFSPQGKALWAVVPSSITFASVVTDEAGNAYVVGADLDKGAGVALGDIRGIQVAGGGSAARPMLAKYSAKGEPIWTRIATVKGGGCQFLKLARAEDGSLYATGTVSGICDFGNGVSIAASAPQSPVLVKYDAGGKALWARISVGAAKDWRIRAVAVMGKLVYWAIQAIEAGSIANYDFGDGVDLKGRVFVVCYDSTGKALWARGIPPMLDYFDPSLAFGDGSIFLFNEGSDEKIDFGGGVSLAPRLSYIVKFAAPADKIAVCVDDRVRLRSAGSLKGDTLGYLANGDRVAVLERSADKTAVGEMLDYWYRVRRLADGLAGWCYGYYLKME